MWLEHTYGDSIKKLEQLHNNIRRCRKCRLYKNRQHAVPGEGDPRARLMFIGEAPGEKEDQSGKPFCGRSGDFLDELLETIHLERKEIFITSCVKCRPPKNRKPYGDELSVCYNTWLIEQIRLIDPEIVLLLGEVATRTILGLKDAMKNLHGKRYEKDTRLFIVTYHPAAGMRFPEIGDAMRQDFQLFKP